MKFSIFTLLLLFTFMFSRGAPPVFLPMDDDGKNKLNTAVVQETNLKSAPIWGNTAPVPPKPYTFYPNPARGNTLYIDYQAEQNETVSVRILNMLGVALVENSFVVTKGSNNLTVDISRLLKGLYLLEVSIKPKRFVDKLVVEGN